MILYAELQQQINLEGQQRYVLKSSAVVTLKLEFGIVVKDLILRDTLPIKNILKLNLRSDAKVFYSPHTTDEYSPTLP